MSDPEYPNIPVKLTTALAGPPLPPIKIGHGLHYRASQAQILESLQ